MNKTISMQILSVGAMRFLSLPITFVISIIIARALSPEDFGAYTYLIALLTILSLPVTAASEPLITREIAKYSHNEDWPLFKGFYHATHYWITVVFISLVIVLGSINLSSEDPILSSGGYLHLVVFMIPLLALNTIRTSVLKGLQFTFHAQLPDMIVRPFLLLLMVSILSFIELISIEGVLLCQMLSLACAVFIGERMLNERFPEQISNRKPHYQWKYWGNTFWPIFIIAAASSLNSQVGVLVLGSVGTSLSVAVYQIAFMLASLVVLPLTILNLVIAPYIQVAYQTKDKNRLRYLFKKSCQISSFFSALILIPILIYGNELIHLVYGVEYTTNTITPLILLSVSQFFNVLCGSVGLFLIMTGYEKDTLFGQVIALLVSFIAALVFVPHFGSTGAALATAIGLVAWNVVLSVRVYQRLGIHPSIIRLSDDN